MAASGCCTPGLPRLRRLAAPRLGRTKSPPPIRKRLEAGGAYARRNLQEQTLTGAKKAIIRTGLEALYFTGSHLALKPFFSGIGAILTLHHVRPARQDAFQPNRLLEVTPEFLEEVIERLRRADIDLVSLDEMRRRLLDRTFWRRFVCFTFDDGYCDNLTHAYPILRRHRVPFAVYVPTSFPDRIGELWWIALEAVIARNDRIGLDVEG